MNAPIHTRRFIKDLDKCKRRGLSMNKLKQIIELLLANSPLPVSARNHKLKGDFQGYWECHIEPDWLLVYKKTDNEIILVRTGSHADLF